MNEFQIFKNSEFGEVRIVTIESEPYFVGKDVTDILGYQNGSRDINRHVDEEDRQKAMFFDGTQDKETIIINESGLYSLIISSKLPNAKKFKRWVTSEVLPSIRKNGGYIANQENLSEDELLANAVMVAQRIIEKQKQALGKKDMQIQAQAPKVLFADAVSASHTSILIGDLAKILRQNGLDIGQNRLFELMRQEGFLIKSGSSRNLPTQKAMDLELFEIKERTINEPNGSVRITKTTKVTGKGQQYFINRFLQAS